MNKPIYIYCTTLYIAPAVAGIMYKPPEGGTTNEIPLSSSASISFHKKTRQTAGF